jgi:tetratricopeptide (TPR) repeat protein
MRSTTALTLLVSLGMAGGCQAAGNWQQLRQQTLEASQQVEVWRATELARAALAAAEQPSEQSISMSDLGILLFRAGHNSEALILLEKARDLWGKVETPAAVKLWTDIVLGEIAVSAGDYPVAEQHQRAALEIADSAEELGRSRNALGETLRYIGNFEEARTLFAETAAMKNVQWQLPADATAGLADIDRERGDWQTSRAEWEIVVEAAREHQHALLQAIGLRGEGIAWMDCGDTSRGEPLVRRALALLESINAPELQIATTLTALGEASLRDGKPALAEESLQRARSIQERDLGEGHPTVAMTLELIGGAEARRGNWSMARSLFNRAQAIVAAHFGANSPAAGAVMANWALEQQRGNRHAEASVDFARALPQLNVDGVGIAKLRQSVAHAYARSLKALHRGDEAKQVLRSAFATNPMQQSK